MPAKLSIEDVALEFLQLGSSRIAFQARGKTWPNRIQHPDDVSLKESMKQKMNKLNLRGAKNAE